MLKNHPKGLVTLFFTNLAERFGFYTMLAILVLFLQAKFGLSEQQAGEYFSWFFFAVYGSLFFGGMIADATRKYKIIVFIGQVMMVAGYILLAIPSLSLYGSIFALLIVSLGSGLFKGNVQVVLGHLYNDEKYSNYRNAAFMIFYMGINIGAFLAPFIAINVRDWWLHVNGFLHDASIPALAHQFLNSSLHDNTQLLGLAKKVTLDSNNFTSLNNFCVQYLDVFNKGYKFSFAIAALAMMVSIVVYRIFHQTVPEVSGEKAVAKQSNSRDSNKNDNSTQILIVSLSILIGVTILSQLISGVDYKFGLALGLFVAFIAYLFQIVPYIERPKILQLSMLLLVIIIFWMTFNQTGLTFTFFARDYVAKSVDPISMLFFNLRTILCVLLALAGLILLFQGSSTLRYRFIGGVLFTVFTATCVYFSSSAEDYNPISPEIFQAFNPFFIILLTPIIIGLFTYLEKRRIKLTATRKIIVGLIIGGLAYIVLMIISIPLPSPNAMSGMILPESQRIAPAWLIFIYLLMAIAEILISPMGASYVSKVSPKQTQGMMQGGWIFTAAIGSKLVFTGSLMWGQVALQTLWMVFAICLFAAAGLMIANFKKLDKIE